MSTVLGIENITEKVIPMNDNGWIVALIVALIAFSVSLIIIFYNSNISRGKNFIYSLLIALALGGIVKIGDGIFYEEKYEVAITAEYVREEDGTDTFGDYANYYFTPKDDVAERIVLKTGKLLKINKKINTDNLTENITFTDCSKDNSSVLYICSQIVN